MSRGDFEKDPFDLLWRARLMVAAAHELFSERGDASSAICSPPAIPAAKSVWRSTTKKLSPADMASTVRNSPAPTSANSPTTSPTLTAHPNCAASGGH